MAAGSDGSARGAAAVVACQLAKIRAVFADGNCTARNVCRVISRVHAEQRESVARQVLNDVNTAVQFGHTDDVFGLDHIAGFQAVRGNRYDGRVCLGDRGDGLGRRLGQEARQDFDDRAVKLE